MDDKNTEKKLHKPVILIFGAAACIIVLAVILIRFANVSVRSGIPQKEPGKAFQIGITANPGGAIPTLKPTITPTALLGMESPAFCKIELSMLHNKAEALGGGGMLIPARYEQGHKTCVFTVRDRGTMAEIGNLYVDHDEGKRYGLRVEMSDDAGGMRTDPLILWGTAALCALDGKITADQAREAVQTALSGEPASAGVYDLSLKKDPIWKKTVIEILDRTKN